ncbi:Adipokinetic hormone receptor [Carabus blaptoides fortunei]
MEYVERMLKEWDVQKFTFLKCVVVAAHVWPPGVVFVRAFRRQMHSALKLLLTNSEGYRLFCVQFYNADKPVCLYVEVTTDQEERVWLDSASLCAYKTCNTEVTTMKPNEDIQDHRQLLEWSLVADDTYNNTMLPIDMRFNHGHVVSIIAYSILMVLSAIGNITVLVLILRRRRQTKSRINLMLMHLATADLLVTFLMMPMEIGWAITVSWRAGDAMCRIMAFFRMFGLYLSSFVLVCISIDRFYAVVKPLHFSGKDRRVKLMLAAAWVGSMICSLPQALVFHVESHPNVTWYNQCITYNSFPTRTHELAYSMFGMLMMYTFPLVVIFYSYASTFLEIYRRARESSGGDGIRRSSLGFLGRAKIQTLKMTIVIVFVFFVCWTPYYVMSFWYWFDRDSAIRVDQRIQKALFLFACTNSCMNPIVYGAFNIRAWRTTGQTRGLSSSQHRPSVRHGMDVVCLVSWKKPSLTNKPSTGAHRRDVCLSCGESFEVPAAMASVAETVSLCSMKGK